MLGKGATSVPKAGLERLIPFLIFLLALWSIGDELPGLKDMKFRSVWEAWPLMVFLVIGSTVNWGIEALKWYCIGQRSIGLSVVAALKGVLTGTAIGMWMPGRIGSWLGKLFYVPFERRGKALYPLMASSGIQFLVTFFMAATALLIWSLYKPGVDLPASSFLGHALLFTFLFLAAGVGAYFLLQSPMGQKGIERLGLRSDELLSFKDLSFFLYIKVLGLASLRYLVFLFQFLVVLRFWIPSAEIGVLLLAIPVALLVITVLPSFVLAKLGIREMVIVTVMAPLFGHEERLILASFSIWLVNLALPAMTGAGIALFSRFHLRQRA